ncbi:hypothetical protein QJS66_11615 [Kocuria rhizophila]|nr:hypothetical protein QJS66_11615 [Kocuria rhizophila]
MEDFARAAGLAQRAGYDGVEIMGSEGYLIDRLLVTHTNQHGPAGAAPPEPAALRRGGRAAGRESPGDFLGHVPAVRPGPGPGHQEFEQVLALGREVEFAGASIVNTGIGWHEAQMPTIATSVPPAGFTWVSRALREHLEIPVAAVNHINTPEMGEAVMERGDADLVCLARPFLADRPSCPRPVRTAGRDQHVHRVQPGVPGPHLSRASGVLPGQPAGHARDRARPGPPTAGAESPWSARPAGLAFAEAAAQRGHRVTLFESTKIGGQFPAGPADPRQGGLRPAPSATSAPASAELGVTRCRTGRAATAADLESRTRWCWPRG